MAPKGRPLGYRLSNESRAVIKDAAKFRESQKRLRASVDSERRLALFKNSLTSEVVLARRDEQSHFEQECEVAARSRWDQHITTRAIILAAFASETDACRATGLEERSVVRCEYVVAALLMSLQQSVIEAAAHNDPGFVVLKRSYDETPLKASGPRGKAEKVKVMNQRGFLQVGRDGGRLVFPGLELLSTSAAGLREGLSRVMPDTMYAALAQLAKHGCIVVHMHVSDSLAANRLAFTSMAIDYEDVLHFWQRCDSHQLAIVSKRPMDTLALLSPLYAFSKLVTHQSYEESLRRSILQRVASEVRENTHILEEPDAASRKRQALLRQVVSQSLQIAQLRYLGLIIPSHKFIHI
eukprot:4111414-Amphidinium_carterae.1